MTHDYNITQHMLYNMTHDYNITWYIIQLEICYIT